MCIVISLMIIVSTCKCYCSYLIIELVNKLCATIILNCEILFFKKYICKTIKFLLFPFYTYTYFFCHPPKILNGSKEQTGAMTLVQYTYKLR